MTIIGISVLSVVGYALVGVVMSIILGAMTVQDYNGKADGLYVVLGAVLWPFTLGVLAVMGVGKFGAPFGRLVARRWEAAVRRLNPQYKGFS